MTAQPQVETWDDEQVMRCGDCSFEWPERILLVDGRAVSIEDEPGECPLCGGTGVEE